MRRTTICKQRSDSNVDNAEEPRESQDINVQIQIPSPQSLPSPHWELFVSHFAHHPE